MALFRRPIRIRWWIFSFTLAFPMLSYVQRLSVQDLAATIMPSLHVSQLGIGWLATAFTTAYALAQFPGGIFSQRFGARWALVAVGVLGLVATLAFPLAPVVLAGTTLFAALLLAQALLGVSQGPLFPAATAVIESWFPANRWAMAGGLQTAAMNLGGACTPMLVVLLGKYLDWQGTLLWLAAPAVLLTVAWARYGRDTPRKHPAVTADELAEIGSGAAETARPPTMRRLLRLLSDRNVLLLTLSYLCMNYAYYLLSFWSYLYLVQVRHFSGIEGGFAGAMPWIGAGLGAAAGGFVSDRLAGQIGVRWGYRLVPLIALPIAGLLLLITLRVETPHAAVATLIITFFMVEVSEGTFGAAIMRVARADVAAAFGVLNTGGNVGGSIAQPIMGYLTNSGYWVGAFSSGTVFALMAGALWLVIDPERRAKVDEQARRLCDRQLSSACPPPSVHRLARRHT
jgi:ACS family glucarate transporter-like MFS transporter